MGRPVTTRRRQAPSPIFSIPTSRPVLSSLRFAPALIRPLVVLAALAAGCAPSGPPEDTRPSAPDSAVTLELIAEIGCADCDDGTALTPAVIQFLADGRLAVLDRFEPFVRIFGAKGQLELAFGNKGQGPGELGIDTGGGMYFSGIYLFPWPDGSLSVLELIPPVLETFAVDGRHVAQETLDLPFASPSAQAYAEEPRSYFRLAFVPMSDAPEMIQRCVFDAGVAPACGDFIAPTAFIDTAEADDRSMLAIAATQTGRLVVAETGTYRVWVLDTDATVVREFARDIPMPQKSEQELGAERAANDAAIARGLRAREIETHRGHIAPAGLQVDGAGRLWVLTQRYGPETSVFDVIDAEGNLLNEVTVDARIRFDGYQVTPFAVAGMRLAAMTHQLDGSTRVNVYEIVAR